MTQQSFSILFYTYLGFIQELKVKKIDIYLFLKTEIYKN